MQLVPASPTATLRAGPARPARRYVRARHRPGRAVARRRLVAVALLVALAFLLTVLVGQVGAGAELDDPVAGEAVVEPGQTLWDVAVASAPAGVDPRAHLEDIRRVNGLDSARVAPWTVVLIPAR